jgi:hypothetical protein
MNSFWKESSLVSRELLQKDVDPAYTEKKVVSRVKKLLKKSKLRDAFLLKEILNRPYS